MTQHTPGSWQIEREARDESEFKVDRIYTVKDEYGEDGNNVHYSLKEAVDFLYDGMDTKNGQIFDGHTDELVAYVVNGKIKLLKEAETPHENK